MLDRLNSAPSITNHRHGSEMEPTTDPREKAAGRTSPSRDEPSTGAA
jgi:hypothetical protein